jgi:hypothetical protein
MSSTQSEILGPIAARDSITGQLLAPILSDKVTSGMTGLALRTGPLDRQTKGASFLTWTTPNSAARRPITPCAACSISATAGSASSALAPRRRVARRHECVGWAQSQFCDFLFSRDNSLFRETDSLFREKDSLFREKDSLFRCVGNWASSH